MTGKGSRAKGARVEREIVALHDKEEIPAEKISRSGYLGPDLRIADSLLAEVKARADGFKLLERWIRGVDVLFLRKDGDKYPIVAMTWGTYILLMRSFLSLSEGQEGEMSKHVESLLGAKTDNGLPF